MREPENNLNIGLDSKTLTFGGWAKDMVGFLLWLPSFVWDCLRQTTESEREDIKRESALPRIQFDASPRAKAICSLRTPYLTGFNSEDPSISSGKPGLQPPLSPTSEARKAALREYTKKIYSQ